MERDYRLLIGACGWRHAGWAGDFYPEDLPEDWQLDYYANAWPLVLITAQERATADWPACLKEGGEVLSFVGQRSWQDDPQQAEAEIQALGKRYLATLLEMDAAMDVEQLAACVARWQSLGECVVDFAAEPSPVQLDCLRQRNIGWCWRGQGPVEGMDYGSLAITRVGPQARDARRIRGIVESCLAGQNKTDKPRLLLFDGTPPDVEEMNMAEVIAALL